jgi:hypothetical protein
VLFPCASSLSYVNLYESRSGPRMLSEGGFVEEG